MAWFNKNKETQQPRRRKMEDPRQSAIIDMPVDFKNYQPGSEEMDTWIRRMAAHYCRKDASAFEQDFKKWVKGETVIVKLDSSLTKSTTEIGLCYDHFVDGDGYIPQGEAERLTAASFGELSVSERKKYYPVVQIDLYEGGCRVGGVELEETEQDVFSEIYWKLAEQFNGITLDSDTTVYSLVLGEVTNGILPLHNIGMNANQVHLTIELNVSKAALDAGEFDDNLEALEAIKTALQESLKAVESACKALVNEPDQPETPENGAEKHLLDYLTEVIMGDENISQSFKTGFESRVNNLSNAGKSDDQIIRALRLTGSYADYLKKAEDAKKEAEAKEKGKKRVKTPKPDQNQDKDQQDKGQGQKKQQKKRNGGKDKKTGDGGDQKKATGPIWNSEAANKVNDSLPKQPASFWEGKFSNVGGFNADALKGKHVPSAMTIVEVCRFIQSWLKAQARANGEDVNKVKIPAEIYRECKEAIEAANKA